MIHLEELLSAYLDGEASPPEVVRVEHHLTDCHRCRIRMTEINAARSALRSLPVFELPPQLVAARQPAVSPTRRPMVWAGVAAAVAATVITVATITTPPPEPLSLADVSRQFGARTALDVGVAPLKLVIPSAETLE
ncbi:hypothetical protein BH23ACT5_BH23ACT5_12900 [soil metagenome]